MGRVWLAEDERLGQRVALKVLRGFAGAEDVRRFSREARAVAALSHPNIVRLIDFGEAPVPWIAMELLEGETLASLVRRRGKLPPERAVFLVAQALAALGAAHAANVVHRDVKPSNVFVCKGVADVVKVLDFGLSKVEEPGASPVTRKGFIVGTPHFMAPEQVQARAVDARSDLHALGATLYVALSGEEPFCGADTTEVLAAIVSQSPRPLTDHGLEPALWRVVERALAKEPDARFQSAEDMLAALEPWLPSAVGSSRRIRAPSAARATRAPRRERSEAGLAVRVDVRTVGTGKAFLGAASMARDGRAIFAVATNGLLRWTARGWDALPTPVPTTRIAGVLPSEASVDLLVYGPEGTLGWLSRRGAWRSLGLPPDVDVHAAVEVGDRIVLAGERVLGSDSVCGCTVHLQGGSVATLHDERFMAPLRAIAAAGDRFVAAGDCGSWIEVGDRAQQALSAPGPDWRVAVSGPDHALLGGRAGAVARVVRDGGRLGPAAARISPTLVAVVEVVEGLGTVTAASSREGAWISGQGLFVRRAARWERVAFELGQRRALALYGASTGARVVLDDGSVADVAIV
jgi:hypothetical protein